MVSSAWNAIINYRQPRIYKLAQLYAVSASSVVKFSLLLRGASIVSEGLMRPLLWFLCDSSHPKLFDRWSWNSKEGGTMADLVVLKQNFRKIIIVWLWRQKADQMVQWLGKPAAVPEAPGSNPE